MVNEALTHAVGGRSSAPVAGPEVPTLAERFVSAFRLPYAIGCAVVGLVLFGVFPTALSTYAETSDPGRALVAALSPANLATGFLVAFAFYAPRYMRQRLAEAGVPLSTLLQDGEGAYRRIFAGIASSKGQFGTWLLFLAALLSAVNVSALMGTGPSPIVIAGGPPAPLELFAGVYDIVSLAVATLALSSVVWAYATISKGIHRFGGTPLALRPYYEDAFLGLKPVGSLALSLAGAYFGFIALLVLVLAASPGSPSVGDIIGLGGFLSGLIVLGFALFFLPLRRLHRLMIEQKRIAGARLRETLAPVFQEPAHAGAPKDIGQLFRLDMMDRKFSSTAVWPFDMRTLGKLSVIALSVTAILISRIVALVLRI